MCPAPELRLRRSMGRRTPSQGLLSGSERPLKSDNSLRPASALGQASSLAGVVAERRRAGDGRLRWRDRPASQLSKLCSLAFVLPPALRTSGYVLGAVSVLRHAKIQTPSTIRATVAIDERRGSVRLRLPLQDYLPASQVSRPLRIISESQARVILSTSLFRGPDAIFVPPPHGRSYSC